LKEKSEKQKKEPKASLGSKFGKALRGKIG